MDKRVLGDWRMGTIEALANECGETARELHDIEVDIAETKAMLAERESAILVEGMASGEIGGGNETTRKAQLAKLVLEDEALTHLRGVLANEYAMEGDAVCMKVTAYSKRDLVIAALNSQCYDVVADVKLHDLIAELDEIAGAARRMYNVLVTDDNVTIPAVTACRNALRSVYGEKWQDCEEAAPDEEMAEEQCTCGLNHVCPACEARDQEVEESVPEHEACPWKDDPSAKVAVEKCIPCADEECPHYLPF